jgi:hypothetical protein
VVSSELSSRHRWSKVEGRRFCTLRVRGAKEGALGFFFESDDVAREASEAVSRILGGTSSVAPCVRDPLRRACVWRVVGLWVWVGGVVGWWGVRSKRCLVPSYSPSPISRVDDRRFVRVGCRRCSCGRVRLDGLFCECVVNLVSS